MVDGGISSFVKRMTRMPCFRRGSGSRLSFLLDAAWHVIYAAWQELFMFKSNCQWITQIIKNRIIGQR